MAQPIWRVIRDVEPDLHIQLGDSIYADYDGQTLVTVTPDLLREKWARLGARPEFRALRQKVPMMATWDNHDYGAHAQGASFPLRRESQAIFLDFWREPADSSRRETPGVYTSTLLGPQGRRVQIILLDTRFFKSEALPAPTRSHDESGQSVRRFLPSRVDELTILGEQQWAWLAGELDNPADLRIIASSTQLVANEKGLDEWGNFPLERTRLFELLKDKAAHRTLFLSGNVHFGEVSEEIHSGTRWIDFTSSGLTPANINCRYAEAKNSKRIAGPYCDVNFGLVELDWRTTNGPSVTLKLMDKNAIPVFKHAVHF